MVSFAASGFIADCLFLPSCAAVDFACVSVFAVAWLSTDAGRVHVFFSSSSVAGLDRSAVYD
ncbi:hypothetical protein, partial [Staphylococcus felis]|uniref:hypothetical protein n=1 Tax=Staphylococcus felis TaxID=46127 RepID=UPI00115AED47